MNWTTKIKNNFEARFGINIFELRKLLDNEKYTVSVPASSTSHHHLMRISNRQKNTRKILELKNGYWIDKETENSYENIEQIADNIEQIV